MTFKADNAKEFDLLLKNDWRVAFQDNNGLYRIFGLYNGMQCGNVDFKTGGGKSDLNGYTFTLTAQEEKQSFFIEDLEETGLIEDGFDYYLDFNIYG
jgi:hypothetical protein